MPIFNVNAERCHKDGICSQVCPIHVVAWSEGGLPEERKGFGERCMACGQCMAFCPHGACSVEKLSGAGVAEKFIRKELPSAQSVNLLVKTRRSIRIYKPEPLPKDRLDELVQSSRYAPTASNRRDVRWIVVYERAKLVEFGDIMATWLEGLSKVNPAMAAVISAELLAKRWRKGDDVFFRGAPHLVMAVSNQQNMGFLDAAIAATTLELVAHGHGLGACWAGYFMRGIEHCPPLRAAAGLKPGAILGGALMLGTPSIKPSYIPPRHAAPVEWL